MRDRNDNVVVVCSIENIDPMGVHTGDSVTVAPAMTLTDREYQRMRDVAHRHHPRGRRRHRRLQHPVRGAPATGRMVVIEMNPRVSRSSALASKATGFPIAKIAAKLAIGYTLDEIPQRHHRRDPGQLRARARLRRGQGPAVRVREVPRRRPDADHAHEVGRRGHGHRPVASPRRCRRRCARWSSPGAPFSWAEPPGDTRRPAAPAARSRTTAGWPPCTRPCGPGPRSAELAAATGIDPWFLDQIALHREHRRDASRRPGLDAGDAARGQAAGFSDAPDRPAARLTEADSGGCARAWASGRSTTPSTPAPPSSPPTRRTCTRPTTSETEVAAAATGPR